MGRLRPECAVAPPPDTAAGDPRRAAGLQGLFLLLLAGSKKPKTLGSSGCPREQEPKRFLGTMNEKTLLLLLFHRQAESLVPLTPVST